MVCGEGERSEIYRGIGRKGVQRLGIVEGVRGDGGGNGEQGAWRERERVGKVTQKVKMKILGNSSVVIINITKGNLKD